MAKNLTNFGDFQNKRKAVNEKKEEKLNEVLVGDNIMRDTYLIDVPLALIKAFVTKVKNETGQDIMKGGMWSDKLLADEIVKYIVSNFMQIDQLPTTIVTGDGSSGKAQGKRGQGQAQVQPQPQPQPQTQPPAEEPAPIQPASQGTQNPPAQQPNVQQTAQQIPAKENI